MNRLGAYFDRLGFSVPETADFLYTIGGIIGAFTVNPL